MKTIYGIIRNVVILAMASVLIGNAYATSQNVDVSDLWWNKNQNGTGYQFTNTGDLVFATAYIYGPNRQPYWISAQLTRADTTWTGPLYVTTGPYYGGLYDTYAYREAGTMTFSLTGISNGELTYSIDGVVVNEPLQRQPLTLDEYTGSYKATVTQTTSGCSNPAFNGTSTSNIDIIIEQSGNQMKQTWQVDGVSCVHTGTYSQVGRMGTFTGASATSACNAAPAGNAFAMFQMTNQPYMFMARWRKVSSINGCISDGEVGAVIAR